MSKDAICDQGLMPVSNDTKLVVRLELKQHIS